MHRLTRATLIDIAIAIGVIAAFVLLLMMGAGCGDFGSLSMVRTSYRPGAASAEVPALSAQCLAISKDVTAWSAVSIAGGILSGGSGVASILSPTTPRYVTGGVSIGLSVFAGVSAYLSTAYAALYARECGSGP